MSDEAKRLEMKHVGGQLRFTMNVSEDLAEILDDPHVLEVLAERVERALTDAHQAHVTAELDRLTQGTPLESGEPRGILSVPTGRQVRGKLVFDGFKRELERRIRTEPDFDLGAKRQPTSETEVDDG